MIAEIQNKIKGQNANFIFPPPNSGACIQTNFPFLNKMIKGTMANSTFPGVVLEKAAAAVTVSAAAKQL